MKILFILELYYPNIGGIEKLFKSLAEKLVEEGYSVTIITTRFRKDLPLNETINGVKIKRLRISSRFLFTFFGIFGMLKEARKCYIIHTTSFNAAFPARLAGWFARKKVIITFHEAWGSLWFRLPFAGFISKRLFFFYEWFILHLGFHHYIAVSDYTADCLARLGVKKHKISRIYNGLDYATYEPGDYTPPDNFVFTYFGRLGISKGLDIIPDAAQDFLESHPDAHLKMIIPKRPKGMYRKIRNLLKKIPANRITLLHNLRDTDLHKELHHSSCIMIPSYSEGFCFAAAEAIAMGIPLISSGKGALAEVVSGKHITMESQDGKGLSDALEKAYAGNWEVTPIRRFDFDDTVRDYLGLYQGYWILDT
ncbi:MAG: glycosyltransferase family 4 protein [Bacteroidales bacterium]|nr:glycosyltransferase family 4 protein [Bacteroidales bacterium]